MPQYLVLIEGEPGSYSAYVPDLPGCVAAADTTEEIHGLIREAVAFHIEGMRNAGESVPPPSAVMVDFVQAE